MMTKKTVRVPVAADGAPVVVRSPNLDKTRELPACESFADELSLDGQPGAPREILDDEVTVPVQSSIEGTVTYELLRRQSTERDPEDEEHREGQDEDHR
jgi:hypothetical protein